MSEEERVNYPVVENQKLLDKAVFKLKDNQIRDSYKSGYSYWQYFTKKYPGTKFRPLLGRMNEKQFQIYDMETRGWVDRNMYDDYGYDQVDDSGAIIMNDYGKPKRGTYIEHKKEYLVEFEEDMPIEVWNKETKTKETQMHKIAWARISRGLAKKLEEVIETISAMGMDRGAVKFVVDYDVTKPLMDRYKVKLVKE